jgi:hypothetical protein
MRGLLQERDRLKVEAGSMVPGGRAIRSAAEAGIARAGGDGIEAGRLMARAKAAAAADIAASIVAGGMLGAGGPRLGSPGRGAVASGDLAAIALDPPPVTQALIVTESRARPGAALSPLTHPVVPQAQRQPYIVTPGGTVLTPTQVALLERARVAALQPGATPNSIGQAGEEFLAAIAHGQGRPQQVTATALGDRIADRVLGQARFEVKNTSRRQANTRFFRRQIAKERLVLESQPGSESLLIGTRGFTKGALAVAKRAGVKVIGLDDF